MDKQIYIIRGHTGESYDTFADRIASLSIHVLENVDPHALWYTLTRESPPRISVIPFGRKKIAAISLIKSDPSPLSWLLADASCSGAYLVEEALPVSYSQTRPEGEITPGACLLTLFSRRKGLDRKTFLDRWHKSHTPMSLRFHPLWNYNRNVVLQTLTTSSEPFEGIVEEQTRTRSELLNPFQFFGPPYLILQRMLMVYKDTRSFLDYGTMETYLVEEHVIKMG